MKAIRNRSLRTVVPSALAMVLCIWPPSQQSRAAINGGGWLSQGITVYPLDPDGDPTPVAAWANSTAQLVVGVDPDLVQKEVYANTSDPNGPQWQWWVSNTRSSTTVNSPSLAPDGNCSVSFDNAQSQDPVLTFAGAGGFWDITCGVSVLYTDPDDGISYWSGYASTDVHFTSVEVDIGWMGADRPVYNSSDPIVGGEDMVTPLMSRTVETIVGQEIRLSVSVLPTDIVQSGSWGVSDDTYADCGFETNPAGTWGGIMGPPAVGSVDLLPNESEMLEQCPPALINFTWWRQNNPGLADEAKTATYSVVVLDANSNPQTFAATANFNLESPVVTVQRAMPAQPKLGADAFGRGVIELGDVASGTPGFTIRITGGSDAPARAGAGSLAWVQVITGIVVDYQFTHPSGGNYDLYEVPTPTYGPMIDLRYPAEGNDQIPTFTTEMYGPWIYGFWDLPSDPVDFPQMQGYQPGGQDTSNQLQVYEDFISYLIYMPAGGDSEYVPIYCVDWHWGLTAVKTAVSPETWSAVPGSNVNNIGSWVTPAAWYSFSQNWYPPAAALR